MPLIIFLIRVTGETIAHVLSTKKNSSTFRTRQEMTSITAKQLFLNALSFLHVKNIVFTEEINYHLIFIWIIA